ncbi:MAG: hypothetical protein AAB955_03235 [Patescibacteria group bacterium]
MTNSFEANFNTYQSRPDDEDQTDPAYQGARERKKREDEEDRDPNKQ